MDSANIKATFDPENYGKPGGSTKSCKTWVKRTRSVENWRGLGTGINLRFCMDSANRKATFGTKTTENQVGQLAKPGRSALVGWETGVDGAA